MRTTVHTASFVLIVLIGIALALIPGASGIRQPVAKANPADAEGCGAITSWYTNNGQYVEGSSCYCWADKAFCQPLVGSPNCWIGWGTTHTTDVSYKIYTLVRLQDQCNTDPWRIDNWTQIYAYNTQEADTKSTVGAYQTCSISHQYEVFTEHYRWKTSSSPWEGWDYCINPTEGSLYCS
jgi:hypothetical protein